jgi:DNA-binding response OmpR family regulator
MGSGRILVVEDDRDARLALRVRLEAAGYEVLVAEDAYLATRLARCERPDLVILDVGMPAGNGLTVHERINTIWKGTIPVLYVTGSMQDEVMRRARELGARGVFGKPLNAAAFMEAVHRCTQQIEAGVK